MNKINNKSNLAPFYGNNSLIKLNLAGTGSNSKTENKKLFSYTNIFKKSILWVKLYDNSLYLYLNKNTKNKFSILEPKTKKNKLLTPPSFPPPPPPSPF